MKDDSTRDRPLSSDEMIARARRRREGASGKRIEEARSEQRASSDDLIRRARKAAATPPDLGDLANLEIDLTPEVAPPELPDPLIRQAPRPRRVRRVPVQRQQGPVSSDPSARATAAIMAAVILLITIGALVAAVAANSTP